MELSATVVPFSQLCVHQGSIASKNLAEVKILSREESAQKISTALREPLNLFLVKILLEKLARRAQAIRQRPFCHPRYASQDSILVQEFASIASQASFVRITPI